MYQAYLGVLVVVAGLSAAGVDYANQARIAGADLIGFGVDGYWQTVETRYLGQRAEIEATNQRRELLSVDPRDLLPEAPEGWTRAEWGDTHRGVLSVERDPLEGLPEEARENMQLKLMAAADEAVRRKKDRDEVYVYEKDGAFVALRLEYMNPRKQPRGVQAMAMGIVGGNLEAMSGKDAFGVIQGVAYREELGLFGTGSEERAYRVFTGRIGSEIRISARATASDGEVRLILDAIDYDRLNRMLRDPVPGIGSDAPRFSEADEKAIAEVMIAGESRERIEKGRQLEDRLRAGGEVLADAEGSAWDKVATLAWMVFGSGEGVGSSEPAPVPRENVRINRANGSGGIGSCANVGASKRCRVGD